MSTTTKIRFRDDGRGSYMVCFVGKDWGSVDHTAGLWGPVGWFICRDRKGFRSNAQTKMYQNRAEAAEALIQEQTEPNGKGDAR